jgi:hypothetical protein
MMGNYLGLFILYGVLRGKWDTVCAQRSGHNQWFQLACPFPVGKGKSFAFAFSCRPPETDISPGNAEKKAARQLHEGYEYPTAGKMSSIL